MSSRKALSSLLLMGAAGTLAGCLSAPKVKTETFAPESPSVWGATEKEGAYDSQSWLVDFGDPVLMGLIDESLANNFDLQAAAARLDAALAASKSSRADYWPTLTGSGSGTKARRNSSSGIQQTPTSETYGLNARFSWEIDLWGKLRNGYRADLADEQAALVDYKAARLSLAAQTAKAWYEAIAARQLLDFEERSLEALKQSAQIVEDNFASGLAEALDVRLVRANVAGSESTVEGRRRTAQDAVRALEILLGRYPGNELEVGAAFPEIGDSIPAGLPSELLLRRPDVVSAERALAAAEQRKYEASKARLPSITLSLSRGTSASDLDGAFELMDNRIWSQSLSIAETLFQGGKLKADAKRARANYEVEVATYAQAVLDAYREVETELSNQESYRLDYEYLKVAAFESVEAEKLAWEQYGRGLSDITTALDAVRRSLTAQRTLIEVTNDRIQSRIDLHIALAGGFELDS